MITFSVDVTKIHIKDGAVDIERVLLSQKEAVPQYTFTQLWHWIAEMLAYLTICTEPSLALN